MIERSIYFIKPIGMPGPIKIGISAMPERRMSEMLVWSPFALEIAHRFPGTYVLEKSIQQALANDHLRHEWFSPTPRVVQLLADLQSGTPIEEALDLTACEGSIRTAQPARQKRRPRGQKPNSGLTPGQLECLQFICAFQGEQGRVPTYQEIADGMGLHSKSGVHRYITGLEERGRLTREPTLRCGYQVVNPPTEPMRKAA